MAEELGLEERLGNRRAVDRDEGALGARAERVERAREQLLARAALALEQHRRVGRRRSIQRDRDLFELRIVADDLRRAAASRELLFEDQILGHHAPLDERTLDEQQQMIGIHRLGQKIERAFFHRRHGVLDAAECGHDDDGQLGVELLGCAQDAEAVAFGQPKVGQDDGRTSGAQRGFGFGLVAGLEDAVALRFERKAQHRAEGILVFDEQNRRIGRWARARAHPSTWLGMTLSEGRRVTAPSRAARRLCALRRPGPSALSCRRRSLSSAGRARRAP